jgi:hypothetical protein
MFDLKKKAVNETAILPLNDADDLPMVDPDTKKQVSVEVFGPGSSAFAKAEAVRQNRLLERVRKGKKMGMSAEEQTASTAEFLSAITSGFDGLDLSPWGDAPGRDLFRALYSDRSVGFIADQVNKFVGDWGNFTSASATSSSSSSEALPG